MPRRKSSPEPLMASARRESHTHSSNGVGRVLAQPGDEELGDLVVVDGVGVGRVGDPDVAVVRELVLLGGT